MLLRNEEEEEEEEEEGTNFSSSSSWTSADTFILHSPICLSSAPPRETAMAMTPVASSHDRRPLTSQQEEEELESWAASFFESAEEDEEEDEGSEEERAKESEEQDKNPVPLLASPGSPLPRRISGSTERQLGKQLARTCTRAGEARRWDMSSKLCSSRVSAGDRVGGSSGLEADQTAKRTFCRPTPAAAQHSRRRLQETPRDRDKLRRLGEIRNQGHATSNKNVCLAILIITFNPCSPPSSSNWVEWLYQTSLSRANIFDLLFSIIHRLLQSACTNYFLAELQRQQLDIYLACEEEEKVEGENAGQMKEGEGEDEESEEGMDEEEEGRGGQVLYSSPSASQAPSSCVRRPESSASRCRLGAAGGRDLSLLFAGVQLHVNVHPQVLAEVQLPVDYHIPPPPLLATSMSPCCDATADMLLIAATACSVRSSHLIKRHARPRQRGSASPTDSTASKCPARLQPCALFTIAQTDSHYTLLQERVGQASLFHPAKALRCEKRHEEQPCSDASSVVLFLYSSSACTFLYESRGP
eukprot:754714-Hanusia_phi.AAC.2